MYGSEMKVTVCFGNTRVVVPCGNGELLVKDLIREATLRYKKAARKCGDSWVTVHNLQSQSTGGILDPDDKLNDVCDDREQIVANFEDGDGVHHGVGDGASGSSVGTNSPDIFNGNEKYRNSYHPRTDIEVTGEQIANGLNVPLHVRRGSEPALNQLAPGPAPVTVRSPPSKVDRCKRWSAAPIIRDEDILLNNGHRDVRDLRGDNRLSPEHTSELKRGRNGSSNRLSMQFLGDNSGGYRWQEAAERVATLHSAKKAIYGTTSSSKSLPRHTRRREPLGQANPGSPNVHEYSEVVVIEKEPNMQLGLHVVPDYDRMGKQRGLLVQGIEPNGIVDRSGKVFIGDRIVEINGQTLVNVHNKRVEEFFKPAQLAPELVLKLVRSDTNKPPAPIYPHEFKVKKEILSFTEEEEDDERGLNSIKSTNSTTTTTTKKLPIIGTRNPKSLLTANTRKIGRKYEVELLKGPNGLGLSITTRDNPAGGNAPIYIKNILPKGAAVEDGRLKPGDRLLEVNGINMTGKSQSEAVSLLRNAPAGNYVKLVVSRQEDVTSGPVLPRAKETAQSSFRKSRAPSPITERAPEIPPLPHTLTVPNGFRDENDTQNGERPRDDPDEASVPVRNGSVAKIVSQFQQAAARKSSSNLNNPLDAKTIQNDDGVFPWKYREILTFNIPVHDTEKAGLGVSVKGKTTATVTTEQTGTDLGIFVKNVINGGAASRDKRLRTNDQLLSVNGVSLLHQSNSEAMETLRRAMLHTEGPVPGSITLTIARRVPSPAMPSSSSYCSNVVSSGRNSAASLLSNSSETDQSLPVVDNVSTKSSSGSTNSRGLSLDDSGKSESSQKSGSTVIFLSPSPYTKRPNSELYATNHVENHYVKRQNGTTTTNHVRIESWGGSSAGNYSNGGSNAGNYSNGVTNGLTSVTHMINGHRPIATPSTLPNGLRNESYCLATHDRTWNGSYVNYQKYVSPTVPTDPIVVEEEQTPYETKSIAYYSNGIIKPNAHGERKMSVDQASDSAASSDASYARQQSAEATTFSRDAVGRQSMSEKRHATLDAKSTDTYQRTKRMREERLAALNGLKRDDKLYRVGSAESIISVNRHRNIEKTEVADKLGDIGPALGMKKSSSLESLQTMVHGIQMQEDDLLGYSVRGNRYRGVRGRGCDNSFLNAIYSSYGKSIESINKEQNPRKHWLLDPPNDGFARPRAVDSQKSMKKKGFLKGIGSMFRSFNKR